MPRPLDVRLDGGALLRRGHALHQRMLRRQHEERHAVDRVGPRGEDGNLDRLGSLAALRLRQSARKRISAPSLRPIQFVCISRVFSGQSIPSKRSSSSA